ncbi:Ionotropic glutamate receptor domain and Glutamate receptor, L-glutamate/glycine-binding domain-containing protein [Strongyloides ratti]|uniref:Ionotropic glutamate receptor domain and Glutamate receptor, L-glutamate/glycine-binding domain-containing protein n=1 Tax=Strongyloides ratti TaxID=34506 RepID=A0A090N0K9_STRRB|nr:Ionotropic glutamate receptor domain and Glutamate receptor, L-glutamate/glycine-binding domain-containing protein [Strongyloides ratti]CEF70868.1 Ionotropic glutamate receptor domain and Glutamate receptor, L-glutamate/glycine-binding domain-containing protein [Strongyloides ratti]
MSQTNVATLISYDIVLQKLNEIQTTSDKDDKFVQLQASKLYSNVKKNYGISELIGGHLKVMIPKIEPPYVNYLPLDINHINIIDDPPGVVIMILKTVAEKLNLTYEFVISDEEDMGTLINGTWTGAFGKLIYDDYDIIAGGATLRYDRTLYTDMTFPFYYQSYGMIIRSPKQNRNYTWLIVTNPFSFHVWIAIVVSIIFSAISFKILTKLSKNISNEEQYSIIESLFIFFSIFLQQALTRQPISCSCRILISVWWLSSMTLLATFTGSLTALFAVDSIIYPFKDFDGMVQNIKNGKYSLLMDTNYPSKIDMIAKSNLPSYKNLWHEMYVNHRVDFVDGFLSGIEHVKNNPNYVFLAPMEMLDIYSSLECNTLLINNQILSSYLSIPFKKDSKYSDYFSDQIRQYMEHGFIDKWIADYKVKIYSENTKRCNETTTQTSSDVSLGMDKAKGALYVYLGGVGLSILIIFIEFIIHLLILLLKKLK